MRSDQTLPFHCQDESDGHRKKRPGIAYHYEVRAIIEISEVDIVRPA